MWYYITIISVDIDYWQAWPALATMDPSWRNGSRPSHQAQEHSCQTSWTKNSALVHSLIFSVNMALTSLMINAKRAENLWVWARRCLLKLSKTDFKRVFPWSQICSVVLRNQTHMVVWRSAGLQEQVSVFQKLILLELVHLQLFGHPCQFHLVLVQLHFLSHLFFFTIRWYAIFPLLVCLCSQDLYVRLLV